MRSYQQNSAVRVGLLHHGVLVIDRRPRRLDDAPHQLNCPTPWSLPPAEGFTAPMNEPRRPDTALPAIELARWLESQSTEAIAWVRHRKSRFRRSASIIRMLSLSLAAAATVILGLQHLNTWAGLAFSFVAVGTLVNAVEPFFNWRSRWILMEEAQYKIMRIREELEYMLLKTPADQLRIEDVDPFFHRLQEILTGTSQRWLEHRRGGQFD
jgi:hypothetical protein